MMERSLVAGARARIGALAESAGFAVMASASAFAVREHSYRCWAALAASLEALELASRLPEAPRYWESSELIWTMERRLADRLRFVDDSFAFRLHKSDTVVVVAVVVVAAAAAEDKLALAYFVVVFVVAVAAA